MRLWPGIGEAVEKNGGAPAHPERGRGVREAVRASTGSALINLSAGRILQLRTRWEGGPAAWTTRRPKRKGSAPAPPISPCAAMVTMGRPVSGAESPCVSSTQSRYPNELALPRVGPTLGQPPCDGVSGRSAASRAPGQHCGPASGGAHHTHTAPPWPRISSCSHPKAALQQPVRIQRACPCCAQPPPSWRAQLAARTPAPPLPQHRTSSGQYAHTLQPADRASRHARQQSLCPTRPPTVPTNSPVGIRFGVAKHPLPSAVELGAISQPSRVATGTNSFGCEQRGRRQHGCTCEAGQRRAGRERCRPTWRLVCCAQVPHLRAQFPNKVQRARRCAGRSCGPSPAPSPGGVWHGLRSALTHPRLCCQPPAAPGPAMLVGGLVQLGAGHPRKGK